MLQNILFIIENVKLCEQLEATVRGLLTEAGSRAAAGCGVHAAFPDEYEERMQMWNIQPEEMLAVTDHAGTAQKLLARGAAVVAVRTAENQDDDFTGVSYALEGLFHPGWDYFQKVYERCHGLPWTILETERCRVREIQVEDLDRLYEIYAEPSITTYMEALYTDREKEKRYTENYIRHMYGFYGYGMWIVEEKQTGRIIGRAGLENRSKEEIEIGYLIEKEYQRQGYGFEVCSAIIQYAGDVLELPRLACYVEPQNEPSIRLCKKLGFKFIEERQIKKKHFQVYEYLFS